MKLKSYDKSRETTANAWGASIEACASPVSDPLDQFEGGWTILVDSIAPRLLNTRIDTRHYDTVQYESVF